MVVRDLQIMDLGFADYNNQQRHEVSPEQVDARAASVKPSNNFSYRNGLWRPNHYTGFAVVSMVENNILNSSLSFRLNEIQDELVQNLDSDGAFYMVPEESFHQTVANTLSNENFRKNIAEPGIEQIYPRIVQEVFNRIELSDRSRPIRMKLAGLSIFGTAIGALFIFESEMDYERIISFRNQFYNDQQLNKIGIQMTRPFIGHITLAYAERHLESAERLQLASVVKEINAGIEDESIYFTLSRTELRRYYHLAEFVHEDHFPIYHFNS